MYPRMGFVLIFPNKKVHLGCKILSICTILIDHVVGTNPATPSGQGILIHWALDLILKEVDAEATKLVKPNSSFHSSHNWSWDTLQRLSLHSQHSAAVQEGPIIWSVLTTIAVNKDQRQTLSMEEGSDKRDPWQVSSIQLIVFLVGSYSFCREQQQFSQFCFTSETVKLPSSLVLSA